LNIFVAPLLDEDKKQFGKLITWKDITERRLADDARQQARDEMFILLHSITSAASRALTWMTSYLNPFIRLCIHPAANRYPCFYWMNIKTAPGNKT
jgi:hypothetical protein